MTVLTVPETSDVVMTATGVIRHMCPHVDELDHGVITIAWRVNGQTIELHSLADYLANWGTAQLSHEQLTDRIRHDLSVLPDIELISVGSEWTTAGLEVTCSAAEPRPESSGLWKAVRDGVY